MNQNQVISKLKDILSVKRLDHSIRVAKSAKELAEIYKINTNIIEFAALVHDIAKQQTPDSLKTKGINVKPFNDIWLNYPSVWHAFIGPSLVEKVFPQNDFILNGIIDLHTTGEEAMSKEAMIIFIADFIEPDREHSELHHIRKVAKQSLEEAVALITRCSINKLISKSVSIHPKTWQCWNYYCKYISNS